MTISPPFATGSEEAPRQRPPQVTELYNQQMPSVHEAGVAHRAL